MINLDLVSMTEIEEEFFSISSRSLRSNVKKFSSRLIVRDWIGEILILVSKLKKWLSLTSGYDLKLHMYQIKAMCDLFELGSDKCNGK